MKLIRRTSIIAALAAAAVLVGSPILARADDSPPGDIPDDQAFVTFRGVGYSLKVPEGWQRTRLRTRWTFTDKYNSISVNDFKVAKRPTVASVTKTELPRLKGSVNGFDQPTVTTVQRSAGTAILIKYLATSASNPVTGKAVTNDVERYEFWRSGKLAVLTLAGPKGADNVDPWKLVSDSFAWK